MTSSFEDIDPMDDTVAESTEEGTVMTRSDYAQVIFHSIPESYTTAANVNCRFTITATLHPSPKDWVGLYRVGWSSAKDYIKFMWCQFSQDCEMGKEVDSSVIFQATELPADDGEFYQFCYVTSSGQVRGASTPFQFKQRHAYDFVAIEDEDNDIMVIKTRTTALEEELDRARVDQEELSKRIDHLEKERDALVNKMVHLEKECNAVKEERDSASRQIQENKKIHKCLEDDLQNMILAHNGLNEKIDKLIQEKEVVLKRLEEKEKEVKKLQQDIKVAISQKDAACGKTNTLEEEIQLFKTNFVSTEGTIQGHVNHIDNLKKQLANQEGRLSDMERDKSRLAEILQAEQQKVERQLRVSQTDQEQIKSLRESIANAEDKLSAADNCKKMLSDELRAAQQAHQKISDDLESAISDSHSLKCQLSKREEKHLRDQETIELLTCDVKEKTKDLQLLVTDIDKLEAEKVEMNKSLQAEQDGPLYALQTAQQNLQQRFSKVKAENQDLKKQLDEHIQEKKKLKNNLVDQVRTNKDLEERLLMGQDEYQKTYIECSQLRATVRSLQKKVSRVKKDGDSGGAENPSSPRSEAEVQTVQLDTADTAAGTDTELEGGVEVADLTAQELQTQLNGLGYELETRTAKTLKYKQLYKEQKERCRFLQTFYQEDVETKDQENRKLNAKMQDMKDEYARQIRRLENISTIQRRDIEELTIQLAKKVKEQVYEPPAEFCPPQINDSNKITTRVTQSIIPQAQSPISKRPQPQGGARGGVEAPTGLVAPIRPLPPPMEPVKLPSAKIAALKASISQRQTSLDDSLIDNPPSPPLSRQERISSAPPSLQEETNVTESNTPTSEHHVIEINDNGDGSEEQFVDAEGDSQKVCPVCNAIFPQDIEDMAFVDHVDTHYGPMCPICNTQFEVGFPQDELMEHVNNHFDQE